MALKRDGTVVVWGQLGAGPVEPPPGLKDAVAIASGWECCFALLRDGSVSAWGETQFGPPSVPDDIEYASSVSAVAGPVPRWVLAERNGTVRESDWSWDVVRPADLDDVVQVSAGEGHVLALRRDGTIAGWGSSHVRHRVPSGLCDVVEVSAGDNHSLALRSDGTVVAWGKNGYNQLQAPNGYSSESVNWDGDGYYLPSLSSPPSAMVDPYEAEYGLRVKNLESIPRGGGTIPSEGEIRLALRRASDADKRGDLAASIRIYEAAVEHSARYPTLHALVVGSFAADWMRRGDLTRAIALLERLADSGESYGLDTLAHCLMENGDTHSSIRRFHEAISRWDESSVDRGASHEPLRANTKAGLGLAYVQQGDYEAAIPWLTEALTSEVMSPDASSFTASKLGIVLSQLGRHEDAVPWLRVASESGDAQAFANLGYSLQQSRNGEEGLRWLTRSAEGGYVPAMMIVGTTLIAGGGSEDSKRGWGWIRMAAAAGDSHARDLINSPSGQAAQRTVENTSGAATNNRSGGGCYIATAVYGSYDAPQVRTLRLYRDDQLSRKLAGRLLIRTYYAVSPLLARHFARPSFLNRVARKLLDQIVSRLES